MVKKKKQANSSYNVNIDITSWKKWTPPLSPRHDGWQPERVQPKSKRKRSLDVAVSVMFVENIARKERVAVPVREKGEEEKKKKKKKSSSGFKRSKIIFFSSFLHKLFRGCTKNK